MLPNSHHAFRKAWTQHPLAGAPASGPASPCSGDGLLRAGPEAGAPRVASASLTTTCGCIALMAMAAAMSGRCSERPLVDLDAQALAGGPAQAWPNRGAAGGFFLTTNQPPVAGLVAGRPALTFSGKEWLQSSLVAPSEITGGRPFTLAAWVHPTRLVGKQVIVSWASRPNDCAEFGYGKSREAAFCGWLRDTGYRRVPAVSQWHHLAFAYADGSLRIYVDGQLDSKAALKPTPKPGEPILLGAAWDATKKEPAFAFQGSLATVRVWDRTLSQREIRNDMGLFEPFGPVPADGSTVEDRRGVLHWQAGHPKAESSQVYLSQDRAAVEAMNGNSLLGPALPSGAESQYEAGELALGNKYFWRVQELDAARQRLVAGPVWSFTVSAGPASSPQPRDRVAGIRQSTAELIWKPGRYAVSQNLFFGTDADAVGRGTQPLATLTATASRFPLPTPLEYGRTYYWRVDENNGSLPGARGEVWSFRTEDKSVPGQLTFFVVSDTHYGLDWRVDAAVQALIDQMNFLPGTRLPKAAGAGIVRTPCGVIHLGDITNDGKAEQWDAFARDFGLVGEARLAFPVYELFGNHDGGTNLPVRTGMLERNRHRAGPLTLSSNGVHYAWGWQGIRLISLNVSVGTHTNPYDPQNSLGFLRSELARLSDTRQPLVLLQHFGFDKRHSLNWWPEEWRTTYYETIKDYNVLGIFHGHDHETEIFRWYDIDIYDVPHIRDADVPDKPVRHGFFVVQITSDEMVVAERKSDDTWGLTARKRIQMPVATP